MQNQYLKAVGGDKRWFDRYFSKQHVNLIRRGFAGDWSLQQPLDQDKPAEKKGVRSAKSELLNILKSENQLLTCNHYSRCGFIRMQAAVVAGFNS
jgi:hypothetical protein